MRTEHKLQKKKGKRKRTESNNGREELRKKQKRTQNIMRAYLPLHIGMYLIHDVKIKQTRNNMHIANIIVRNFRFNQNGLCYALILLCFSFVPSFFFFDFLIAVLPLPLLLLLLLVCVLFVSFGCPVSTASINAFSIWVLLIRNRLLHYYISGQAIEFRKCVSAPCA